jgi:hypothetical protein
VSRTLIPNRSGVREPPLVLSEFDAVNKLQGDLRQGGTLHVHLRGARAESCSMGWERNGDVIICPVFISTQSGF